MKNICGMIVAASVMAGVVAMAEDVKKDAETTAPVVKEHVAKVQPEAKSMTLTGTITKEDQTNKKTGQTMTAYVLTDKDGVKHRLPSGKKGAEGVNLDENLGVPVELSVMAAEMEHGGKTRLHIQKIVSIKKLAEAAPAAPVAPAAPAAPVAK